MSNTNSNILNRQNFWRFQGFGSSIVGFSCYALSPTFKFLFGEWNWWKILIYTLVSSIFPSFMLFPKALALKKKFIIQANLCFFVFLLTCIHSFYQDKREAGKNERDYGKMLTLFSLGGFALMSLSLSRQTNIGFDVGASNFFLACFFLCGMKLNLKVTVVVGIICYVFVHIQSYYDSTSEMNGGDTAHVTIEMAGHSQNNTGSPAEGFHFSSDVNSDDKHEVFPQPYSSVNDNRHEELSQIDDGRVHDKPKMHECSICGLEFSLGEALEDHMRKHRPATNEAFQRLNTMAFDLNLTPLEIY